MSESRPLKYWMSGGSILTTVEQDGVKAVVFLTREETENLFRWYKAAETTQDSVDFFAAVQARNEYIQVIYAD